jgi:D-sedoheptulose 7-phosphate isomerase
MTGKTGGRLASLCDYCIRVPSDVTVHIQQAHLALEHIFCMIVEQCCFGPEQISAIRSSAVRD